MTFFRKIHAFFRDGPDRRAIWLAVAGLIVYVVQAFWYAHTTISSLDEGAYLYKGILFATGQYRPFQLYGVWTNKAPLAFLIPGYVQLIFGPGLRTGRYLAIFFGTLSLVATWTAARRLGGKWLAAAAVWAFALSPAIIKIYSEAVTQSTIVFLMAAILALSLGEKRPLWQLVLSGFLAGVMIMVRQNMVIVLPVLVLYIAWQNGWKPALFAALAGGVILVFFHILYWPYIVQLWTPWLPAGVASIFADFTYDYSDASNWKPLIDWSGRWLSFFQGVRYHFVAITGVTIGLVLWPRRGRWNSPVDLRAAVFLGVLFIGLLVMHSWASIANDYCVFCFTPYLAFFNVAAILFLVQLWRVLDRKAQPWRQLLLGLTLILLITGVGYSAAEDLGNGLLNLNVPRLRDGHILPGFTTLWELLFNKYSMVRNIAEKLVSAIAGALSGIVLLFLAYLIYRRLRDAGINFAYVLACSFLTIGLLLSPLLAGPAGRVDCSGDIISANEKIGAYLEMYIPQGKRVYWIGGLSVVPLIYVPGINIYPPQINNGYSFVIESDPQELLKYGFWNEELAVRWFQEADFVIVEGWRYGELKNKLSATEFDELPRSPVQTSCLDGSGLRVFRRK